MQTNTSGSAAADQFGGTLFVAGVAHRPDEGDRHRLDLLLAEVLDGRVDRLLIQRRMLAASLMIRPLMGRRRWRGTSIQAGG